MQYITLNDGSFILNVRGITKTFNLKSFNYHKIKREINNAGSNEETILSLMQEPVLLDGIYEVYLNPNNVIYAMHYTSAKEDPVPCFFNDTCKTHQKPPPLDKFLGSYASTEAIKEDWPEFFI